MMTPKEALKELHKFIKLKTTQRPAFLDVCEEAMYKQIPLMPKDKGGWFKCMNCAGSLTLLDEDGASYEIDYCPWCGQRILWEDDEE